MNTLSSASVRALIAGAFLATLASFSTASSAGEAATPPQVVVKFSDLNISTPQGAQTLYRRIQSAAVDVCWRMYDGNEAAYKWNKGACLKKVIGDAVTRVDQPALSGVFAANYGISPPVVVATAEAR